MCKLWGVFDVFVKVPGLFKLSPLSVDNRESPKHFPDKRVSTKQCKHGVA